MKVKIQTTYPKKTLEVNNVFFSSDLHIGHQAVIDFGRGFKDLQTMNKYIIDEINFKAGENDLLVLLGDILMKEKNYEAFLNSLNCKNIMIVRGNHDSRSKLETVEDKLLYLGDYLELTVDGKYVCCSHYPMFNFHHQEENSIMLHGHLHADENPIVKEIHKYRVLDVGIDNYHKTFGKYSIFSIEEVKYLLKDKLTIERH